MAYWPKPNTGSDAKRIAASHSDNKVTLEKFVLMNVALQVSRFITETNLITWLDTGWSEACKSIHDESQSIFP